MTLSGRWLRVRKTNTDSADRQRKAEIEREIHYGADSALISLNLTAVPQELSVSVRASARCAGTSHFRAHLF